RAADCIGWIAGTGFEPHPELLESGARLLPLLGNDRATIDRVRNPRTFFGTLAELKIESPETRFDAPPDPAGWLVKDFAGSGGWHIRRADAESAPRANAFFQRDVRGRPMSVLFLAAGDRTLRIGINELIVRGAGAHPYLYRGAIGPITDLPPTVEA